MKIRKLDVNVDDTLKNGKVFADETNNILPLDDEDSIKLSVAKLGTGFFDDIYTKKERIYIIDRILSESKNLSIAEDVKNDLSAYINNGGNMYTGEQLKAKVDKAVADLKADYDKKMDELKKSFESDKNMADAEEVFQKERDELQSKIDELTKASEDKDNEIKSVKEEKDKLVAEKIIAERVVYVNDKFADLKLDKEVLVKKVDELIKVTASLNEDDFKAHIDSIAELAASSKDDLVGASQDVPNGKDKSDDKDSTVDKILKNIYAIK